MGSKTPHGNGDQGHDAPPLDNVSNNGGIGPRARKTNAGDGDGCIGSKGGGDASDDDDDDHDGMPTVAALNEGSLAETTITKKKKKSKKSKKKKASASKQTSPPTIALDKLFPTGNYPAGRILDYASHHGTARRTESSGSLIPVAFDLEETTFLNNYRKAAEVHRQTRKWAQEFARPGVGLTSIADGVDASIRALLDNDGLGPGQGLKSGPGFPTGLSLNNIVAHYTPNPGFKDVILQKSDVMKVDFGVHINGWIVDSAFTMSFDPQYDNLLAAVKDATDTGIKTAGIDVRISDVSAAIQEAMESYEVEIDGKVYPVKAVRNITGHNIKQYRIHGGKSIPFVKNSDQTKMKEGEIFAIETFGTTGKAWLRDGDGIYGYGLPDNSPARVSLPLASANKLYKTIKDNFGTLVFRRQQLEHLGCERYLAGLHSLVSNGILDDYKPLVDIKGSYSAQFEHTILLRPNCKEVISRGDDY